MSDAFDIDQEQIRAQVQARLFGTKAAPIQIGHYTVLRRLGSGAMGVVYLAHDDQLDRRVAIKLMQPEMMSQTSAAAPERLLREAQSLARLSHPNVVTVHEVGLFQNQPFVALEFVDGQTLGSWLKASRRSLREIKSALLEAGRGLHAVHQAGLIHRDFKPDNVLIDHQGRVRIVDFGLARQQELEPLTEPPGSPPGECCEGTHDGRRSPSLTHSQAVMGTPAYMSPEQFTGKPVDARTDQFAFCVTCFEAFHDQRPFAGTTLDGIKQNVLAGTLRPLPRGARQVPGRVQRVIERGLSPDPQDRYPDMTALLSDLERDAIPARLRRTLLLLSILFLVLASGLLVQTIRSRGMVCSDAQRHLSGVWDQAVELRVRQSFSASTIPFALQTFDQLKRHLDQYTRQWVAARTTACEATHFRLEQSSQILDLQMHCLDGRLNRLHALVDILSGPISREVHNHAVQAALELGDLTLCNDAEALRESVPPPADPKVWARVKELDQRLDRVDMLREAGQYADGLAMAEQLARESEALPYPPIRARSLYKLAVLQDLSGKFAQAEETLNQVLTAAAEANDQALVAEAWIELLWVVGYQENRSQQGLLLIQPAEVAVRMAKDTPPLRARLYNTIGSVQSARGDHLAAAESYRQALSIYEQIKGPLHPRVGIVNNNLGSALRNLGKYAEGKPHFERSLSILRSTLGPEHPSTGWALNNLGLTSKNLGSLAEAQKYLEECVRVWEGALGPEHPNVAFALNNLGEVLTESEQYEKAAAYHLRALQIREKTLGPAHPKVGWPLHSLAVALRNLDRLAEARQYEERALAIWEKALGPTHPYLGYALNGMGILAQLEKNYVQARGYLERSLAMWEKTLGPDHVNLTTPLLRLGAIALAQKHSRAAAAYYQRAAAVCAKNTCTPSTMRKISEGQTRCDEKKTDSPER